MSSAARPKHASMVQQEDPWRPGRARAPRPYLWRRVADKPAPVTGPALINSLLQLITAIHTAALGGRPPITCVNHVLGHYC